jgi:hypothetical protein
MGLIAVVYLAKKNLPFSMDKEGAEIDDRTGAIYFRDAEKKKQFPREQRQAIRIKLGTSYDIIDITKEIGPLLGAAESVLSGRVLYDVSHSGDLIELGDLDRLEVELTSVRERVGQRASKVLTQFLSDMVSLVSAARNQRNPIVFV